MPTFACNDCGHDFDVPLAYIYRKVRCPKCHSEFIPAHAQRQAQSAQKRKPQAPASTSKLTVMVSSIALLAVVGLIYLLFIRDRWEHQNSAAILLLAHDAEQLTTDQQFADAKSKYDQLFQLVGNHDLSDKKLQQTVQIAREDAAKVSNELIAAGDRLRQEQQQSQINAQIALKRQQEEALRTQAQQQADAALAARRQEETRAADQLAAQQQQERVRQEAIANGPRVIGGSAWLKRGDGSNNNQRRMTILLLSPTVPQATFAKTYQSMAETLSREASSLRGQRGIEKDPSQVERYNKLVDMVDKLRGGIQTDAEQPQLATEQVLRSIRQVNACDGMTDQIVGAMLNDQAIKDSSSPYHHVSRDTTWQDIAATVTLGKVQTDESGAYSAQLAKGQFVLYAISQDDFSIAEWVIPIDTTDPAPQKLDLYNDNALIVNR